MENSPKYTVIALLELLPAWLALPRARRGEIAASAQQIIARHQEVRVRWFDADAFGHGYSDFVICETHDLERYHFLWEELRDSVLFTVPYAQLKDTILGIERGYERYEATR